MQPMQTITKKGEIRSFTDQVRVLCIKNGIDKPTLGQKIGMDNTVVFNAIKTNMFKPEPVVYFRLEKLLCGKDEIYRNKLRSKYEKTLELTEMNNYMKVAINSAGRSDKPVDVFAIEKKTDVTAAPIILATSEVNQSITVPLSASTKDEFSPITPVKHGKSTVDKKARKKFFDLVKTNLPACVSLTGLSEGLGVKLGNVASGYSFVPVDKLPMLFKVLGIKEGSKLYNTFLDLELSCIAGKYEDEELETFEKIFGSDKKTKKTDSVKKHKASSFTPKIPENTSVVNKKARTRFHALLKKNMPEGVTFFNLSETLGHGKYFFASVRKGESFVAVNQLPLLFKLCRIKKGGSLYNKFLDLTLLCITGPFFDKHYKEFEKIFGTDENAGIDPTIKDAVNDSSELVKPRIINNANSKINTTKDEKMGMGNKGCSVERLDKTEETSVDTYNIDLNAEKQEFCTTLTRWLFMKGFTFTKAAESIGCSNKEFEQVISGEICLSPYHVNRFTETLKMDEETVRRLVEIASHCYKGRELPDGLLEYISSDCVIINTLEVIRKANIPTSFWQKIYDDFTSRKIKIG